MFAMNKKMAKKIQNLNWVDIILPAELNMFVNAGFCELDDCVFLVTLMNKDTNANASHFQDKTGYECFINSIHFNDYVKSSHLAYACKFVESCFDKWKKSGSKKNLRAIVSNNKLDAVVKMHVVRNNESWVAQDLNKYEDPVFVIDSTSSDLRDELKSKV